MYDHQNQTYKGEPLQFKDRIYVGTLVKAKGLDPINDAMRIGGYLGLIYRKKGIKAKSSSSRLEELTGLYIFPPDRK